MSPETIDAMLGAGATAEVIAAAWKAEIAAQEKAAEKRREKDRERQRRHRESRDVTVTECDADGVSPKEYISNPHPVPSVNSNELTSPAEPELKPEHVIEAWNHTAERVGLKTVRKPTPERIRKLRTRIKQNTIEDFTEAIAAIERSAFLRGENDRGWKAHFDWMLEPKNFTKLIEGTYDR